MLSEHNGHLLYLKGLPAEPSPPEFLKEIINSTERPSLFPPRQIADGLK